MDAFITTANSAAHTLKAVCRKGRRDIQVTWAFLTDPEMIALYQAVWVSFRGLCYLAYGLGVLSRRAIDKLVEDSMVNHDETDEITKLEDIASDWSTGIKPMLIDSFMKLSKTRQVEILRELGLPWRSPNRRFNRDELLRIYQKHLESL